MNLTEEHLKEPNEADDTWEPERSKANQVGRTDTSTLIILILLLLLALGLFVRVGSYLF